MADPLRLAVDGFALTDASSYRGIGTYLRGLLGGLGPLQGLDGWVLTTDPDRVPAWLHAKRVRRFAPGRWAVREHEARLPGELARLHADVVHSPAQEPPRRCETPWVQTLHGVLPLVQGTDPAELRRWEVIGPRLRSASAFVAVSRHTADQAAQLLGLDRARVHVVPHGVAPCFTPSAEVRPQPEPYLLYVGEYGPEKGFPDAMAVVALLGERGFPHHLRMAGRIAPWTREVVEGLRVASPRPERVRLLGHVDHRLELPDLYRGAAALLVTSRFESFCLPALEALACGTPVLAYDNSALGETLGGCGVLVPDGDVEAMADAVVGVLEDPGARGALAEAGTARAAGFTWERCAREHLEVYRSALADPVR